MALGRRLVVAACVAAAWAASATLIGGGGCGTDAVGIDACIAIENKRCDLSAGCVEDFDVDYCKDYYRDQCLHGIENADRNPSEADVDACLAALDTVAACDKTKTMAECGEGNLLIPGANPEQSPCSVITAHVHDLAACNFVAIPDAGTVASTAGPGGAGGQGGAGGAGGAGAAGGGGSGGATASSSSSSSSASAGGMGGGGTAGGGGTGG